VGLLRRGCLVEAEAHRLSDRRAGRQPRRRGLALQLSHLVLRLPTRLRRVMANVHDVAAAILERGGPMSTMKLQKLAYYCQAWHLVWDEEPLFKSRIEAWANGPVCRDLYDAHRGRFTVSTWQGDSSNLTADENETIAVIVESYGRMDGRELSQLSHRERPWRTARGDLPTGARSNNLIDLDEMADYYGSLETSNDSTPIDELVREDERHFGEARP
jgi:uncharacterized phage-associated protein